MEEVEALIAELRRKGLFNEQDESMLNLAGKDDLRPTLVGYLDGLVNSNHLTRAQADQYITQLGLNPERVEQMRENHHTSVGRKKKLN